MFDFASIKSAHWLSAILALIIGAMVFVLCQRLMLSAFTSGDDGYTAMAALNPQGLWASAKEMAIFQGRFYQLLVYPLAMYPFTGEDIAIANLFKVFTFLCFLAGFWAFAKEAFDGWVAAGCVLLFLCMFDTVGGSYNPFHGLPLWFGLGCGLLLFSMALHLRALRESGPSTAAYLVYGLALLTYEIVLFYAPLYVVITWLMSERRGRWPRPRELWNAAHSARLLAVVVVGYLTLYVVFRHFYPGTYTGAQGFTFAAPGTMLKPILAFSLHSLDWGLAYQGAKYLSGTSLAYASLGLLGLVLVLAADLRRQESSVRLQRVNPLVAALVVVYVFMPNVLYGLTERYRIWAGDGVQVYLGSLYSAVALVVLLYFVVRFTVLRLSALPIVRVPLLGALGALLLGVSYSNARESENFFEQSRLMSVRWGLADAVAQEIAHIEADAATRGTQIKPMSKLCGTGFTRNTELPVYFRNPDLIADADLYWSRYFSRRLEREVRYVSQNGSIRDCDAQLNLSYGANRATLEFMGRSRSWMLQ